MIRAMNDPLPSLPDDLDALKAFALAMAEKAARADRLEVEVAALKAGHAPGRGVTGWE